LLQSLAKEHDARSSRNPMQSMANGWQKRRDSLREHGFKIDRVIREYAVYDSNVALDKGWIDKRET